MNSLEKQLFFRSLITNSGRECERGGYFHVCFTILPEKNKECEHAFCIFVDPPRVKPSCCSAPFSTRIGDNRRRPPQPPPLRRQTWAPKTRIFATPLAESTENYLQKYKYARTSSLFVAQDTKLLYCRHFLFLIEAHSLSMLYLSLCLTSLIASPLSLLSLSQYFTTLNA